MWWRMLEARENRMSVNEQQEEREGRKGKWSWQERESGRTEIAQGSSRVQHRTKESLSHKETSPDRLVAGQDAKLCTRPSVQPMRAAKPEWCHLLRLFVQLESVTFAGTAAIAKIDLIHSRNSRRLWFHLLHCTYSSPQKSHA